MRIIQCIATKGTLLNNVLLDFDQELNVIHGGSDSGKTLLFSALCDLVWGMPAAADSSTLWKDFWMNTVLSVNGSTYRIIRDNESLSVTSLARDVSVALENRNTDAFFSSVRKEFPDLYKSAAGIGSDLFRKSSFAQSPVEEQFYISSFSDLRPLLLSDHSDYYSKFMLLENFFAPDNINNQLLQYATRIKKEMRECEREIEIRNIRESKFKKLQKEANDLKQEIDQLQQDRSRLEMKREQVSLIQKKKEEWTRLTEENEHLRSILQHENDKRGKMEVMEKMIRKSYPRFLDLKNDSRVLGNIKEDFSEIQNLIYRRRKLSEKLVSMQKRNSIGAVFFVVLSLVAAGAVYLLPSAICDSRYTLQVYGVSLGMGLVSVFAGIIMHVMNKKKYSCHDINAELSSQFDVIRDHLAKANINVDGIESDELYELVLHFFQEFDSYSEDRDELESVVDSIDPDNEAVIEKKIRDNSRVMDDLHKGAAEVSGKWDIGFTGFEEFNSDSEDLIIKNRVSEIDEIISRTEELHDEMRNECSRFSQKDPNDEIAQRYDSLKNEHEKVSRQVSTVKKALETMWNCIEKRESAVFNEFSKQAYSLFSEMTDNRTSLNSSDMYARVLSKPLDQVFTKPSLRQIYLLSMKLSLGDYILINGEPLPLILDEPCVYMDKKKIEIVIKYIQLTSQKRQVVILTHDQETYRTIGKHIEIS